jgi:hypothetical protein
MKTKQALYIDLFTGETDILPPEDFQDAILDCEKIETSTATTYRAEEYLVLVLK